MASTNKTSNLNLSQFIATDTPTWLVDYNGDMEKIDAGVGRVEELAETASTQAVGVASGLQTTNQTVTTLSGQVANVQNQANNNTASVNGINQRLGNADISGIGNGTITGAISAQNSNLVNQSSGNSITLHLESLPCVNRNNVRATTFIPFPFYTINTNYNISFNNIVVSILSYGDLSGSVKIKTKYNNGISVDFDFTSTSNATDLALSGDITITF